MKKIILLFILSILSIKAFAVSMEFKQSEVTHVTPYDGGIAIWTKGNKETGYYIKIEEKKEGMLKKNMVSKNGDIYFSNIGAEIFILFVQEVDHDNYIRNSMPMWLYTFSGVIILLLLIVLYYCRKYLVKHA